MYFKAAAINARSVFGAAIVARTFFAGDVLAQGHEVSIAYQ